MVAEQHEHKAVTTSSHRSDAPVIPPPRLRLLALPFLFVLLPWKGHAEEAGQAGALRLIGQGHGRQLGREEGEIVSE